MNRETLRTFAGRWRRAVFTRALCFALCVGGLVFVASGWRPSAWWAAGAFAGALAILLAVERPWRIDAARVAAHLDRTCPEIEESCALFLRAPEHLTRMERLQLRRVEAAVAPRVARAGGAGKFGSPPRRFLHPAFACLAAVGLTVGGVTWRRSHSPAAKRSSSTERAAAPGQPAPSPAGPGWPRIVGGGLVVTPPAYTGRAPRRVEGLDAEVEEGANVAWTVMLDRPVGTARLVFGEGAAGTQTLEVRPAEAGTTTLVGARRVNAAGLYSLAATLPDGAAWNPPELHALKLLPDHPPLVRVVQPAAARTELLPATPPAAPPHLDVEVLASDDYALADIRLIATLAKGSGEAVKFREIPLAFDTDTPAADDDGRARRLTRRLDPDALGLEPGDELYFYIQAYDNRQPVANRTRSETRFVTLRGPSEKTTTAGKGLTGINLVPQYFRSERQIILDTEKLLADQPTIPEETFRERANGLGIDQGLLRLRYGQLLGEEAEGGNSDHTEVSLDPLARAVPEQPAGPRAAAGVAQRFLQEHTAQDRQGGTDAERAAGLRPEHPDRPLTPGEVRAPFVDEHDSREKATYYDPGAKGTMRDALAAMWDAEKYLRTARPQEALAPEHRALEILKDLQQTARAYVQHVGFEAPPIKVAQRRLTGDAGDVPARGSVVDTLPPADPAAVAAREALARWPQGKPVVADAGEVAALRRVEPVLTAAATRQPDVFLPGLQVLRRIVAAEGAVLAEEDGPALRRALLRLLPPARALPERTVEEDPALAGTYFRALGSDLKEEKP